MRANSRQMAFGGMMTALAVVIMNMGSLIPVNTYICPVLCILIAKPVLERCGRRIAWVYYMAVSLLSLMLAPDREAALVYVCLGYYPMLKHRFDRVRSRVLCLAAKLLFFTAAGAAAYGVLLFVMGVEDLGGPAMTAVLIAMWDVLFLLVDRLLGLPRKKKR